MPILNDWIDGKLAEIANKLPSLVHQDAASFACGYNTGYKNALLDLERIMNDANLPEEFRHIYHDNMAEYYGF
jgi:hypothetical protein